MIMNYASITSDHLCVNNYPVPEKEETNAVNLHLPSTFLNKPTVKILCIRTDRSQQTVQTKIRLLLKKQSDQGLRCLPFHQHLLDALMQCYIKLFYF